MRRLVSFAGLLLLTVAGAAGQQPTFKSGVSLLTIDVTVLDRDGKPVPGLTAADFEVKLNGKVQPVRAAAFIEALAGTGPAGPGTGPAKASRNGTGPAEAGRSGVEATNVAPRREPRVFVILVDDLSISPGNAKGLFMAAERFVARLPDSDLIGVTSSSGLSRAVNPTPDRPATFDALKKAVGTFIDPRFIVADGPSVGMSEALLVDDGSSSLLKQIIFRECFGNNPPGNVSGMSLDRLLATYQCADEVDKRARLTATLVKRTTQDQLRSFIATIDAMRAAGGIKHLVILTAGLGISRNVGDLTPVARAAAAAGVQLSLMTEDPNDINMSDRSETAAAVRREDGRAFMNWAQTIADMSGGQFYRVIGTADRFFDRVLESASAVYRLGVELPPDSAPGNEVSVAASVRRPGLTALASHHAVAPAVVKAVPVEQQLKDAVSSGRVLYGVPIRLGVAMRRAPTTGQIEIGVEVGMPSSVRGPLTTVFGLVDVAGALKSGMRTVPAAAKGQDYRLPYFLPVAPGAYRIRFAVADASGTVGSLDTAVTAKLATMGPFTASDVLTSWVDAAGQSHVTALDELPASAVAAQGSIELYPGGAAPADVKVRFALAKEADAAPVAELDASPTAGDGALRAAAAFQLAKIPAGAYRLKATVSVAGQVVGTASRAVRKP